jgi:hypothetical protein
MATMDTELISFLRAKLDADEHNVVAISALAPPHVDVLLESTVPMLDGVRAVVDLYAGVLNDEASDGAGLFALGRVAGLEEAIRHLALIYHDDPDFRARWRPGQAPDEDRPRSQREVSESADSGRQQLAAHDS